MLNNDELFGGFDNISHDRLLMVASAHGRLGRYLKYIEPVNNTPKTTWKRAAAIRLTARMAETIRFNLTARGYRVHMVYA